MLTSQELLDFFTKTREYTEKICAPLQTEDYVTQPVEEVSPPKWHLAHTSWFFEEFVLKEQMDTYQVFDPRYAYLFNSYYESAGEKIARPSRGSLSRPTVKEVYSYRNYITGQMKELLQNELPFQVLQLITLGCHHEKQHQELLLTDMKFILGTNPLLPPYHSEFREEVPQKKGSHWISMEAGTYRIGHSDRNKFSFDNERESHQVYLQSYKIRDNLVTNGEYLQFMNDEGYQKVLLWHAEGWDWLSEHHISAPLYWFYDKGTWMYYTLAGPKEVDLESPVTHISFYEAFAFAQWKGCRLPTEQEWEAAQGNFSWGSRWEWTQSAYTPYPGFSIAPGTIGEYNGKFMVNQWVLRGGSLATPPDHTRPTYRNFFHPRLRWQFTGIRLAK